MKHILDCQWKDNMAFEAELNGHKLIMDADVSSGGNDNGPRPKDLTLASLAGCTGMDIVSILYKMHIVPEYFNIKIEAELTKEQPRYYHKIHLIYEIKGDSIDKDKVERAAFLSQEKYCGVSALLKSGAELTYEVRML